MDPFCFLCFVFVFVVLSCLFLTVVLSPAGCVCVWGGGGGADLMALLGVAFVTFPYGVPSQMWNLTVSNPDLCLLHY